MGLFNRRRKLPAERRPPFERDERLIAWAEVPAGEDAAGGGGAVAAGSGVVAVTNRGLWLPGRAERLGWHEVHKAVWSGRELAVTPAAPAEERDGYRVMVDRPVETYLLLEPGDVPHQVRTRVTASVAYTAHHRVEGGAVRVVARRVSGTDGLSWTVRYDPGTPAADPAVVAQTDQLVAAARRAATAPVA
ncbi:hypothetical protein AB0J86_22515 [Micromonospora sp. NPDC049559]|uniref:hypothetical protein n=1 Tax=Micromonospora sp. NPDC049559 TaxID=3155923 RepID=UPI003427A329